MKLIATKSFTYGTRRLMPDDGFEATSRDARILIGIRKAKPAIDIQKIEKPTRAKKQRSHKEKEQHGLLES